jgi:hypothetical protein
LNGWARYDDGMPCPECEQLLLAQKNTRQKYDAAKTRAEQYLLGPLPTAPEILKRGYLVDAANQILVELTVIEAQLASHRCSTYNKSHYRLARR